MNSRERVMAAINHKEPDYVPLDSGGQRQVQESRRLLITT